MKKIIILLSIIISSSVMADRINISNNDQAKKIVMEQQFVKDQFIQITKLSNDEAELVWTTSKEVGLNEDLGLDESNNSGMKHKFLFENEDGSVSCRFSIYVVYQHTAPLSINNKLSEVTSEASCN